MPRIFPVIRRIAAAASASNTLASLVPGVALAQRFSQAGTALTTGVAAGPGPVTALAAQQSPAVAVAQTGAGTPLVAEAPAVALAQRFSASHGDDLNGAAELVQVTYALSRVTGADVAGNATTSPNVFTNATNAQGTHDGVLATMAGSATQAKDAILRLTYPDPTGKTDLTITGAFVDVYARLTGAVLGNAAIGFTYRVDGSTSYGGTVLETMVDNFDYLTTPRTYDVSATVNTWTKVNNFVAFVRAQTDLGETLISYAVDAIELRITATVTDTL